MRSFKLYFLGSLFVLALTQSNAFAAKPLTPKSKEEIANIDRRSSITVYPLGMLIGRFGVVYSFQVGDRIALSPGISSRYFASGVFGETYSMFDIGPSLGARFFLSNTAFNSSWYLEPTLAFSYSRAGRSSGGFNEGFATSVQGVGGYAWYWNSGVTLNLGAGFGYSYSTARDSSSTGWYTYPYPTIDIGLGYAW